MNSKRRVKNNYVNFEQHKLVSIVKNSTEEKRRIKLYYENVIKTNDAHIQKE